MKLSCIIVDDEYLAIKVLQEYAARSSTLEIVTSFKNPLEALTFLSENIIDLIFLDIQMPYLTGFDLLKRLDTPPMVIFTTARHDYAVQAFELAVLDYLVKPISYERFEKAVARAAEFKSFISPAGSIPERPADYIMIRADYQVHKVMLSNIVYIQGFGEYVKIFLPNKMLITHMSLKDLIVQLAGSDFIQIHKSFIVAKSSIQSFTSNSLKLAEKVLPVGRSFRAQFLMLMKR